MKIDVALENFNPLNQQQRESRKVIVAEIERLQDRLRAASGGCRMLSEGDKCDCGLCKRDRELERLQAELSWIYTHCELRDGDNTHVDSDDVQSAVAAKAEVESEAEFGDPWCCSEKESEVGNGNKT